MPFAKGKDTKISESSYNYITLNQSFFYRVLDGQSNHDIRKSFYIEFEPITIIFNEKQVVAFKFF